MNLLGPGGGGGNRSAAIAGLIAVLLITACSSAAPPKQAVASTSCQAYPGANGNNVVTVYLYETSNTDSCVAVGTHQRIEFFNKGLGGTVVEWFGARQLESDSSFATEPVGELLDPGTYVVEGGPFEVPRLRIVAPEESMLAQLVASDNSLGPVSVGMTLRDATNALGQPVRIDRELAPDPNCWIATAAGDPFSPLFLGTGSGSRTITAIIQTHPVDRVIGDPDLCHRTP